MATNADAFLGFLLIAASVAIPLAWIYCLYQCCSKVLLNKVSIQQFHGLVSRHDQSVRQIMELKESKGKHQIALKQLRSDLKAVNEMNQKNIEHIDNLYKSIKGSSSRISTSSSTYKPYVQKLHSESDFDHDN